MPMQTVFISLKLDKTESIDFFMEISQVKLFYNSYNFMRFRFLVRVTIQKQH